MLGRDAEKRRKRDQHMRDTGVAAGDLKASSFGDSFCKERQEEVDQLLHKTQIEMHATVQPGGRSPKPVNGPTPTSQLKPGSDNVQNSPISFPSQVKGKKRERGEQGFESVKRERSSKMDESDSGPSILKSEIAKIAEKGGLVDSEGVEKLVQLILPERVERKMDLMSRSMLAGIVAATDKFECLNQFVQLRGLPVFDEWLQDFHKGKIGDGGSPKDGDKAVEEFLLVLLRALDKLPVNLHALQMCNIGRSVNHLRTHKNLEIQRKARSLVDTWKKRVEAEMNVIDAKPGSSHTSSWPSKSHSPEVSHVGNRYPGGSSEVVKSSVTQLSASKTASVKPIQGETAMKSASLSPGHTKSVQLPAAGKDSHPRISVGSASELPLTPAREEKSSSSSQSHNYSQSFSGKEDTRSLTVGSMSVNKISSGASRHRKSINGSTGMAVSGGQRESGSTRNSSFHKNSASERLPQSGLTCEKAVDVPVVDGNSHKLIVKIPNRGRSPAQSASGGSFEDPSTINSRASSPVLPEKHDQFDRNLKDKSNGHQANLTLDMNNESWQSNDLKDVLTGSDEGDGSPATTVDEERCRIVEDGRKLPEVTKAASSSSGNIRKSQKLHEVSYNSMNALIESCAKYSGANTLMSPADDVGMNLLASVAAGEISKSDLVSPTDSPQRNTPVGEETCMGDDMRSKTSPDENIAQDESQVNIDANGDDEKQSVVAGTSLAEDELNLSKLASANFQGDRKITSLLSRETPAEHNRQPTEEPCHGTNENLYEIKSSALVAVADANVANRSIDAEESKLQEDKEVVDSHLVTKSKCNSLSTVEKVNDVLSTIKDEKQAGDLLSNVFLESEGSNKDDVKERFNSGLHAEQIPDAAIVNSEHAEKTNEKTLHTTGNKGLIAENVEESKVEKFDEKDTSGQINEAERWKANQKTEDPLALEHPVANWKSDCMGVEAESKEMGQKQHSEVVPQEESSDFSSQETDEHVGLRESKPTCSRADEKEECALTMEEVSCSAGRSPATDSKLKFDLNEGCTADDGKSGEAINLVTPGPASSVRLINPLPFTVSSVSSNLPSSITVAAAAKGPFVPPDDLLRSKGELGWRGSAATSAFRPAEPRKVWEMPLALSGALRPDAISSRNVRLPLDIDLNVPDERVLEDMADQETDGKVGCKSRFVHNHGLAKNELPGSACIVSSGGFDLDLNQVDETTDIVQQSYATSRRIEAPLPPVKSSPSGRISNGEARWDFDLNDGPNLDDTSVEPLSVIQQSRGCTQSQPSFDNLRINNPVIGNFSSWFPPNNYSTVAVPSTLPNRGEHLFPVAEPGAPQRLLGPANGSAPFTPDVYRGSVLSSSPALPFPSAPFQYPVFPFGASFPLPSATYSGGSTTYVESSSGGRVCFPMVHSQLLGPAGAVSSQSASPCVANIPDGNNNGGVESNRKGVRQGLDLNAGPGVVDLEGRDESSPLVSRQLSVASSQALAEEQARRYQVLGGAVKRKEPEGGWDAGSFRYKQSSWQ